MNSLVGKGRHRSNDNAECDKAGQGLSCPEQGREGVRQASWRWCSGRHSEAHLVNELPED
jgi:hypothetical protein